MTVGEAISKADDFMPNQYTQADKVSWLNSLDAKLHREIISTHDFDDSEYTPHTATTDKLIVPEPDAEEIYINYLMAQICKTNAEMAKFNQYITLYNSAYQTWADYYNRTHSPNFRPRFWF